MDMERTQQIQAMQTHMQSLGLDPVQLRTLGKEPSPQDIKSKLKKTVKVFPRARSSMEAFQQRLICGVFRFMQDKDLTEVLGHQLHYKEEEVICRIFTLLEPPESQEQSVILRELRMSYVGSGYQVPSIEGLLD